jgi:hypothetical protein
MLAQSDAFVNDFFILQLAFYNLPFALGKCGALLDNDGVCGYNTLGRKTKGVEGFMAGDPGGSWQRKPY